VNSLPQRHAFVLLPRHSLVSYSGAAEALLAANEALGEPRYEVQALSVDGRPVRAACGTRVAVDGGIGTASGLAAVHVVGQALPPQVPAPAQAPRAGDAPAAGDAAVLLPWLRQQAASVALLGGLGNGAAWLAQAGLLGGYRATLAQEQVTALSDRYTRTVFSSRVYEIDRDRVSCAPGTASIDLFIAWLAGQHGDMIVSALLAHFGLERLRARDERQQVRATSRGVSAKVNEAVALMEANLEEPLPTEEIARLVGVSRRQLERLFKQHLDDMPSRHYAELRLLRAKRLLQHSGQSILQIALACGFASASHFSNAYRARFGHTPRDERSPRAAAWKTDRDADAERHATQPLPSAPPSPSPTFPPISPLSPLSSPPQPPLLPRTGGTPP